MKEENLKTKTKKRKYSLSTSYEHPEVPDIIEFDNSIHFIGELLSKKGGVLVILKREGESFIYRPIDIISVNNIREELGKHSRLKFWEEERKKGSNSWMRDFLDRVEILGVETDKLSQKQLSSIATKPSLLFTPTVAVVKYFDENEKLEKSQFKAYLKGLFSPFQLLSDSTGYHLDKLFKGNPVNDYLEAARYILSNYVLIKDVYFRFKEQIKIKILMSEGHSSPLEIYREEIKKLIEKLSIIGGQYFLAELLSKYKNTKGYPFIQSVHSLDEHFIGDMLWQFKFSKDVNYYKKHQLDFKHIIEVSLLCFQIRSLEISILFLGNNKFKPQTLNSTLGNSELTKLFNYLNDKNYINEENFVNFANIFNENISQVISIKWLEYNYILQLFFELLHEMNYIQYRYWKKVISDNKVFLDKKMVAISARSLSTTKSDTSSKNTSYQALQNSMEAELLELLK